MKSFHISHIPEQCPFRLQTKQFMSSFTPFLKVQIFLPLLLYFSPANSTFLQTDTQSSPFLCFKCPKPPQSATPHHLSHCHTLNPKGIQNLTTLSILQRHSTHPRSTSPSYALLSLSRTMQIFHLHCQWFSPIC